MFTSFKFNNGKKYTILGMAPDLKDLYVIVIKQHPIAGTCQILDGSGGRYGL